MHTPTRRKIAYYTINDPLDKRSWSGITWYLGQALQSKIGDVHFVGPVKIPWLLDKLIRVLQKTSRAVFGVEWIPKYSLIKNIYASISLKRKMRGQHYDFVFAPAAAPELAYLKTNVPIIYFGDATYKIYSDTYKKEFRNAGSFTKWEGNFLEQRSLDKSKLVILTSQWAVQSAIKDYGILATKIETILLGANVDNIPDRQSIFLKDLNPQLTLLFLAVDWDRKGGAIAFETLVNLHAQGISAKLIVCGCVPPAGYEHPFLQTIPFVNKNISDDYALFVKLLSTSHFLLVPTRADCSLLVAMEAASYGMPAITTRTGGVPDVVIDGVNGYCLPYEADGTAYAGLIAEIFMDKDRYHQLIVSSRDRFDHALSWDRWAVDFLKALEKHQL